MKHFYRCVCLILCLSMLFRSVMSVYALDEIKDEDAFFTNWTYPVTPKDDAWKEMDYFEKLESCTMPEHLLRLASTEELAKLVLEYPFLYDILVFQTTEQRIDYLKRTSNICAAFFEKEDGVDVMLQEFEALKVNYDLLAESSAELFYDSLTESGYVKELFLQVYFAAVLNELTEEQRGTIKRILSDNYLKKIGKCENYSTVFLFYDAVMQEFGEIPSKLIGSRVASAYNERYPNAQIDVSEQGISFGFLSDGITAMRVGTQCSRVDFLNTEYILAAVSIKVETSPNARERQMIVYLKPGMTAGLKLNPIAKNTIAIPMRGCPRLPAQTFTGSMIRNMMQPHLYTVVKTQMLLEMTKSLSRAVCRPVMVFDASPLLFILPL